jgi:hypothetical protein
MGRERWRPKDYIRIQILLGSDRSNVTTQIQKSPMYYAVPGAQTLQKWSRRRGPIDSAWELRITSLANRVGNARLAYYVV